MTPNHYFRQPHRFVFLTFVLLALCISGTAFGKKHSAGRSARGKGKASASARNRSSRRGGRSYARAGRSRGGRGSARDVRRSRAQIARDQTAAVRAMERKLKRPLTKRERAMAMRGVEARSRRALAEARRRAEAARRAAIARQMAIDKAMRDQVQSFIAKDDLTGEDPEVRRVAVNALGNHAGTVVVMDPMTGRVYAVVNQEWAFHRGFKPCSTIKLVTGVAGLSENAIPLVDTANDGFRLDLTSALAHSDNGFFQQVGARIGPEKMVNYARELGLGEKTGINVPFEFAGKLPDVRPDVVERRMFSHADGFQVTPLQLGALVSAMANGGRLLTPQIPHSVKEANKMAPKVRRVLPITAEVWQRMVPGMVGAVNYGTGQRAYDPTQTVAGKTGTCIGDNGWVGLFTSYAPLANPRLAVVVIAEGTDGRRHFPAAVAGEIYRQLNHRFGTSINLQVASGLDDEEKEVADQEAAAENTATGEGEESTATATPGSTTQGDGAAPAKTNAAGTTTVKPVTAEPKNTVKRVLMPIPNKPAEPEKSTTTQPSTTPKTTPAPANTAAPGAQRPRRITP